MCVKIVSLQRQAHTHCSPLTHNIDKIKLKHATIHDANGTMNVVVRVGRKKGTTKKFDDVSIWMNITMFFFSSHCHSLHQNPS
jgi:hypothetical protein